MDSTTARRVVLGCIGAAGTLTAVRAVADDDPKTRVTAGILVGTLGAGAALSAVAGPAPDVAAGLAVIVLLSSLMRFSSGSRFGNFRNRNSAAESSGLAAIVAATRRDYTAALSPAPPSSTGGAGGNFRSLRGTASIAPMGDTAAGQMVTWNGITLSPGFMARVRPMLEAAAAEGVQMSGWGYRSNARQRELRIINGCPDVDRSPASSCRVPTAIPGQSKHETGDALDVTQNGSTIGRSSSAYRWLSANAGRFGVFNLPSEPWHWSIDGH